MNLQTHFQLIYGFQIGFELANREDIEEFGLSFGVTIDLGILRIAFSF